MVGDNDRLRGIREIRSSTLVWFLQTTPRRKGRTTSILVFSKQSLSSNGLPSSPRIWACPTFSALGAITTSVVLVFGMTDGVEENIEGRIGE